MEDSLVLADAPLPTTELPLDELSDKLDDDVLPDARGSMSRQLAGLVDMGRSIYLFCFPFFSF